MPNWAFTHIRIEGDEKELEQFAADWKEIQHNPDLKYGDSDFQRNWCGNIVMFRHPEIKTIEEFEKSKWYEYASRGAIDGPVEVEDDCGTMRIEMDAYCAWREPSEFMRFLKLESPSFRIYWTCEEGGCDYFVMNYDEEYYEFHYRGDTDSYYQFYELADRIHRITGKRPCDIIEAKQLCAEYRESNNLEFGDCWIASYEYSNDGLN